MPKFTVDLTDRGVARMQAMAQRYNENTGADLTAAQYIQFLVEQHAIADDLAGEVQRIQREANEALEANVKAAQERLLDELKGEAE